MVKRSKWRKSSPPAIDDNANPRWVQIEAHPYKTELYSTELAHLSSVGQIYTRALALCMRSLFDSPQGVVSHNSCGVGFASWQPITVRYEPSVRQQYAGRLRHKRGPQLHYTDHAKRRDNVSLLQISRRQRLFLRGPGRGGERMDLRGAFGPIRICMAARFESDYQRADLPWMPRHHGAKCKYITELLLIYRWKMVEGGRERRGR
ncbi:hypothetical protein BDV19DRAFT_314782 [Aspergillus venezuelensis]